MSPFEKQHWTFIQIFFFNRSSIILFVVILLILFLNSSNFFPILLSADFNIFIKPHSFIPITQ